MNREKLMKMTNNVTGGKGKETVRREKTTTTDDKRLQTTLKRVGVNSFPGSIEEVNIFKDDVVIQFINPKVQVSVAAKTWAVTGTAQTKQLFDMLPRIVNQLGIENLDGLKKIQEKFYPKSTTLCADDFKSLAALGPGKNRSEWVTSENWELVTSETWEQARAENW